jgi:hypothetical protein
VQAWTARPALGQPAAALRPLSAPLALAPPVSSGPSCSLLPDLYLGELSDAEQELIRDLRPGGAPAPGDLHGAAAHAHSNLPLLPQEFAGGPVRGFSEATNDLFLGIGSLLGVEASWQALPPASLDGRCGGIAAPSQLARAPSSFAGICDLLRTDGAA